MKKSNKFSPKVRERFVCVRFASAFRNFNAGMRVARTL